MKLKQILLLLIVAVVLVGLALQSNKRRVAPTVALAGTELLPALDINKIAAIEITAGDKILRLARQNERWGITNAFDYPADFSRLSQRLIALRDVKIGQVQRGMSIDPAQATQIRLLDAQGQALDGLMLGEGRQPKSDDDQTRFYRGHDGRYVSRVGTPAVYLVKESLDDWSPDVDGWLDTQIAAIPATDVASVELRGHDGETVRLDRSGGTLALEGLDAEKEIFESSRASGVDSALSYLRFTRVVDPALSDEALGFATGSLYRVTLKSGEIYTGRLGAACGDEGRNFRLEVELSASVTNDVERTAAETRVAEANARLKPWTFLIANYAANNMVRTRDELVSPKPVETNAVEQVAAPTAAPADTAATVQPATTEAPAAPAEP